MVLKPKNFILFSLHVTSHRNFALKTLHPHHHRSFLNHLLSQNTKQGWLIRQQQIQNICSPQIMLLLLDGMMRSLACILGVLLNFKPQMPLSQIIAKFVARITGRLREWWINLGEYRQRQAAQCNTLEDFFTIVHNEFLGSVTHYTEVAREEFLLMKIGRAHV